VADAARITHGKSVNCGQICIAPDYALVPRESVDAFVASVKSSFEQFYGGHTEGNPNFTSVVSDRQLQRMQAVLADARAKGATVTACAPQPSAGNRQLPLHIVTGATPDMDVLKEELFGPVLPVVPYDSTDDAIRFINERPRPWRCTASATTCRARRSAAAHAFGRRLGQRLGLARDQPRRALRRHRQLGHRQLPRRRGLSRAVARAHGVPAPPLVPDAAVPPPYGSFVQRLSMKFLLGEADPSLGARSKH
jgi:coniferyl-aldehyde dehydrogenase